MNQKLSKTFIRPMTLLCVIGLMICKPFIAKAETDFFPIIKQAMAVMKEEAAKLGETRVEGSELFFGTTKMNDNFPFVDNLKTKFGCTATLFIKSGDGFVRVTTNVLKDGKRAVGTPLDPKGAAIAAIKQAKAYYGILDILGSQYVTGYEPMKNAAGEVVGVYYIGFLQETGTIEF